MNVEFLSPVEDAVLAHTANLPKQALGNRLKIHTAKNGMPDIQDISLALVGVPEMRGALNQTGKPLQINSVRAQLYKLFPGNWHHPIADLGDILPGASVEDTYTALRELTAHLLKNNIALILIGGDQTLTYPTYRAFDTLGKMVNLVAIDRKFDWGSPNEILSPHSYMNNIIIDPPHNLFHFSNLGYQTYYNSQEELDLMEKLFFEAHRLGEIITNPSVAEPVLRDADIVSVDMTCMEAAATGSPAAFPNGFSSREICTLARYAGISDRVCVFGLYEGAETPLSHALIAQVIWYFIEGYHYRTHEYPFTKTNATKFLVPVGDETICFYKSALSDRWWIETPIVTKENNKLHTQSLLPCTHQDYLDACNQVIPERWWKAYNKAIY